jgi:hypothetical protein
MASGERSSDSRIKTAAVVGQQTLGLLSNQAQAMGAMSRGGGTISHNYAAGNQGVTF